MKPEFSNDPGLSRLLQEWKIDSCLPPRFEEQVWTRIATREASRPNLLSWLRETFAPALLRPTIAIGYAVVLLAAGLAAGSWRGHAESERAGQSLGARYVQSLDPYQMPRH